LAAGCTESLHKVEEVAERLTVHTHLADERVALAAWARHQLVTAIDDAVASQHYRMPELTVVC
jgi:hypothetical protein